MSNTEQLTAEILEQNGFQFVDMMFENVPMRYWRKANMIVEDGVIHLWNDKEVHLMIPCDTIDRLSIAHQFLLGQPLTEYAALSSAGQQREVLGTNTPDPKKAYISPGHEVVTVFINNEWKQFYSNEWLQSQQPQAECQICKERGIDEDMMHGMGVEWPREQPKAPEEQFLERSKEFTVHIAYSKIEGYPYLRIMRGDEIFADISFTNEQIRKFPFPQPKTNS